VKIVDGLARFGACLGEKAIEIDGSRPARREHEGGSLRGSGVEDVVEVDLGDDLDGDRHVRRIGRARGAYMVVEKGRGVEPHRRRRRIGNDGEPLERAIGVEGIPAAEVVLRKRARAVGASPCRAAPYRPMVDLLQVGLPAPAERARATA
jgi:hypothetical protein